MNHTSTNFNSFQQLTTQFLHCAPLLQSVDFNLHAIFYIIIYKDLTFQNTLHFQSMQTQAFSSVRLALIISMHPDLQSIIHEVLKQTCKHLFRWPPHSVLLSSN